MSDVNVDETSAICLKFFQERLAVWRKHSGEKPFFVGLNGIQGAGKTTLVTALQETLSNAPLHLPTLCLSIDDLYLPRAKQQALTDANPDNPLLAQRGQPGTHDLGLGSELFTALKERRRSVKIPKYDKSAYHGKGDRVDESHWDEINRDDESKIRIVLFEGWCVGFRPLRREELESRWQQARNELQDAGSLEETQSLLQDPRQRGRLGRHRFEDVKTVNECLYAYDELTECVKSQLDAFIHLDTEDTQYVYDWRLEQEAALRASKGSGMTEEEVITFVNGYYPAYELYTDSLRAGIFGRDKGKQLHIVVDKNRKVVQDTII